MHHEEGQETEHRKEVEGTGRLTTSKEAHVPGEAVDKGRRHGDARENGEGAEYEDDREVGDLLQSVVAVKPVRLRGQVKRGVVNSGIPRLQEN